ncbi:hypothetical protein LGM54_30605 [Burkholderia cenocepacia]|uniref:hypothetical protein n=1 Tax=Burkholderia cenocepacia TaxID=95486 RepID=UPI001CF21C6D|nr:hypothetical protein [Burkholderia cenocepacia]MCA7967337.1 hypothetical protein [Burkholderia cenocepacia]
MARCKPKAAPALPAVYVSAEELDALHTRAALYAFAALSPSERAACVDEFSLRLLAEQDVDVLGVAKELRDYLTDEPDQAIQETMRDAASRFERVRAPVVPAYVHRAEDWLNRHALQRARNAVFDDLFASL